MSFEFDVFVSYSRQDSAFVEDLVLRLREAGLKVWLDVEQVPPGADIQQTLIQALDACRHVVAVVSEPWLESEYTTWEISASREALRGDRVLVPLARIPFDPKRFGPFLHRRNVVSWPEGDPDPEARFWLVYCGLRQMAPGPRAEWSRRGREVRLPAGSAGGSALLASTEAEREARAVHRIRWGRGRAVYGCDRAGQWMQVCAHADTARHEALFVVGARNEGHEHFLATVQECYPTAPPRRLRKIVWGTALPSSRGEFHRELAEALDCREQELAAGLRSHLREGNLVLVHRPVLAERLRDDGLVRYYTRWLPELTAELGATRGFLKLLQGVAWCPEPGLAARLVRRLGWERASGAAADLEKEEAERELARMRREADPRLPIVLLDPLPPLTREDVEKWSETLPPETDRAALVQVVLSGARDSADILGRIIERLSAGEEME